MSARQQRWSRWWVRAWFANVAMLAALLIAGIPFFVWAPVCAVTFGGMEAFGLRDQTDPYPPLTEVCREYAPRWVTIPVVWALWGLAVATWWHGGRWWAFVALGLLGWLTVHFDVTYDAPEVAGGLPIEVLIGAKDLPQAQIARILQQHNDALAEQLRSAR